MATVYKLPDSQNIGVQGAHHHCSAAAAVDPMTKWDCRCTVSVITSDLAQKLPNLGMLIAIPYNIDAYEIRPPSGDGFAFESSRILTTSPPVYLVTQRVRI